MAAWGNKLQIGMCLWLKVKLSEQNAPRSDEIAKLVSKVAGMNVCPERSWFRKKTSTLLISEQGNGCACSLLTENADWDTATWDMHQGQLPKLSQSLRKLRETTNSGFVFEALWQGEKPIEEKKVSIDELVTIVEAERIGTMTKYSIV